MYNGKTQMSLLTLLLKEAQSRGLVDQTKTSLSAADAFFLVRDMPYKRASSREPQTTIKEWQGTCSGKHYLLKAVFNELNLPCKLMACTLYMPSHILQHLPAEMQRLFASSAIPDVHNYLLVSHNAQEVIVDATWPPETEKFGLPINTDFDLEKDMKLYAEPMERFVVPEKADPKAYKDDLLRAHFSSEELRLRDKLFSLLFG
jgi:hypothetical protein